MPGVVPSSAAVMIQPARSRQAPSAGSRTPSNRGAGYKGAPLGPRRPPQTGRGSNPSPRRRPPSSRSYAHRPRQRASRRVDRKATQRRRTPPTHRTQGPQERSENGPSRRREQPLIGGACRARCGITRFADRDLPPAVLVAVPVLGLRSGAAASQHVLRPPDRRGVRIALPQIGRPDRPRHTR